MLNYIENLKNEYHQTNDEEEKFDILNTIRKEKESCKKIIQEYYERESRAGVNCKEICEHEEEIIEKINTILKSLN